MSRPVVLAIDGPAGAGKSTVAEHLARELDYFYFDTGALYRAVSVRCLDCSADPADEAAMQDLVAGALLHDERLSCFRRGEGGLGRQQYQICVLVRR